MAEPSTVARPYAEAAFKLADEESALGQWSEMLAALALVGRGRARARAVATRTVRRAGRRSCSSPSSAAGSTAEAENFVRVLAR